jgi:hypothetical protein
MDIFVLLLSAVGGVFSHCRSVAAEAAREIADRVNTTATVFKDIEFDMVISFKEFLDYKTKYNFFFPFPARVSVRV